MDVMLAPQLSTDKKTLGSQQQSWAGQLAEARRPWDLAEELGWPSKLVERLRGVDFGFDVRATRYYLGLVNPSDPADPVLRQLLPDSNEGGPSPQGYALDAVGDRLPGHAVAPGLVHKYPGRALLVATGACAVNCRFCFRRNYPYSEINEGGANLRAALEAVASDQTLSELILSGGDPLSLPDGVLSRLFRRISDIPHIRRVRIHSRMPVVLPDRISPELLTVLRGHTETLSLWFVTHFNCAAELTPKALSACRRLAELGIPVLNQSVLLKGVNDSIGAQVALQEGLVNGGVRPYYLHQVDRVEGVAHFEVCQDEGERLIKGLRSQISGIAMPQWVRDLPGRPSKTPLPEEP